MFTQHGGEYSLSGGVVSTELGVELPVPSVVREIISAAEETSGFIWRAPENPGGWIVNVPAWLWIATIGGLLVLLAVDLVIVDRKPHEVGVGEAARWVTFYVAVAVLFGIGIWVFSGGTHAGEYFAGYITEYSLSVDNLFIFLVIM